MEGSLGRASTQAHACKPAAKKDLGFRILYLGFRVRGLGLGFLWFWVRRSIPSQNFRSKKELRLYQALSSSCELY